MKLIWIILFTIKRYSRDTKTLILMILFPIVLILILGLSLKSIFNETGTDLLKEKISVYYIDNDKQKISSYIEKAFESSNIFNVIKINSPREISKKNNYCIVEIEKDFSKNVLSDKKVFIYLYYNKLNKLNQSILETFLDVVISRTNYAIVLVKNGEYKQLYDLDKFSSTIIKGEIKKNELPNAMSYYAVTMLVLIMLYGAIYGIFIIGDEIVHNTIKKVKIAPTNITLVFVGKTIATVISIFIEAMVVVLVSKFLFGANWGNNYLSLSIVIFVFSMFVTILGLTVMLIFNDGKKANAFLQILIPLSTFVAGGYFRFDAHSGVFKVIRDFSPNYITQNTIFNIIYAGKNNISDYLYLFLPLIALFILISYFLSRREIQW